MEKHQWTPEEEQTIKDLSARGFSASEIAASMGMTESAVGSKRRRMGVRQGSKESKIEVSDETVGEARSLASVSPTIRTLDDLLAETEVDLEAWDVERSVVNKWDSQFKGEPIELYQVKAWLRPKVRRLDESIAESLRESMRQFAPKYPKLPKRKSGGGNMLELCLFDHHFGKLSWHEETGEDYDCDIAEKRFRDGVIDLVSQTSHYQPFDEIWLPLGNDLIHIDNADGTTTGGTQMDVDGRAAKIVRTVKRLLVDIVDSLQPVAPVKVIMIPGNHDHQTVFMLGEILDAWYHRCDRVDVDNRPLGRKYLSYGQTLIGYTHGDKRGPKECDLDRVMANEVPGMWASHTNREWHIGHWHKQRETKYNAGDTFAGTKVRVISSLCGTDEWHFANGFVKTPKAAEAFIWHRDHGFRGHFTSAIGMDE